MTFITKFKRQFKKHILNLIGITMLLLIPVIAPLPGPGGVPLLLGGLKLLSINNSWADRLYSYFKDKGLNLSDILFPNNRKIQLFWDVAIALGLTFGISLFLIYDMHFILDILNSTALTTLVLMGLKNRNRLGRILVKFKIITPDKKV